MPLSFSPQNELSYRIHHYDSSATMQCFHSRIPAVFDVAMDLRLLEALKSSRTHDIHCSSTLKDKQW